jgi:hypothetical protein
MSIQFNQKGRTGNNLYQYFISRILADTYKLNLLHNLNSPVLQFNPVTKYPDKTNLDVIYINDTNIYQAINYNSHFENKNMIVDGFFQDSLFFNSNYQKILNYTKLESINQKNTNDIVLHIRLNDFNREGNKSSVIHPQWYLDILNNETFEKLYIVIDTYGRRKYRNQNSEDNYLNYFKKFNPEIISNREYEDFHFIRKFNKIICSNSTFSWWAAFLSNADIIYTPNNWRGKKKLQNIRDISITTNNISCDINYLDNPKNSNQLTDSSQSFTNNNNNITINNNMSHCVVIVSNNKYFPRALETIKSIRNTGAYNGSLVFVYGNDITKQQLEMLQDFFVIPKYFQDINLNPIVQKLQEKRYNGLDRKLGKLFCYHKFHLFNTYFKKWKKIFYIDCGMRIFKPIQPFLEIDCQNKILANSDAQPKYRWKLSGQFNSNSYPDVYNQLSQEFKLNIDYFQSTILLYDTNIINKNTYQDLVDLLQKYFIGLTNDQAIMNLLFNCKLNIWEQVPLKFNNQMMYDYKKRPGHSHRDYIMLKI